MSFQRRPVRLPQPSRSSGTVHAVGHRVYVACPEGGPMYVTLTDHVGTGGQARLSDGSEVEVRAWQPHGKTGTRYCVRSTADGAEGWVPATNLRTSRVRVVPPPAPAAAAAPSPNPDAAGRRFGRRPG